MIDLRKYPEIIIWGACFSPAEMETDVTTTGNAADRLYRLLSENGYTEKIKCWVDSNSQLHGKNRFGKPVCSPNELLKHTHAVIIINSISINAIMRSIRNMKIDNDILAVPYYFYHGSYDGMYDNYSAKRTVELFGEEIRHMFELTDDKTRKTLDIIFNVREKCNDDLYPIDYYDGTCNTLDYFCDEMLAPKGDVTYIDIGAYEGESIEPVAKWYGDRLKRCIAFEPNNISRDNLKTYLDNKGLATITSVFPYAIGNSNKTIYFVREGMCSHMSDTGDVKINQRIFDDIDIGDIIGTPMIKMDIEGAEENALIGMEHFIKEYRPFLAICIYHREDDIYRIPKLIKEYDADYKLYIRDGWHLECWAVPQ